MTPEQIQEIAHRVCTKYGHSNDPDSRTYMFGKFALLDFAQKLLASHAIDGLSVEQEREAPQVPAVVIEAIQQYADARVDRRYMDAAVLIERVIKLIRAALSATVSMNTEPSAKCDGGKCGAGGYCDDCPETDMLARAVKHAEHSVSLDEYASMSAENRGASIDCDECACLPGFCDKEGEVRSVLRMIVEKINAEGPASRDWQGFTHLCELAEQLLDAPPSQAENRGESRREAIYRKALAIGDPPTPIGPDRHEHNFETQPSSGVKICTYCGMSEVAAKKAENRGDKPCTCHPDDNPPNPCAKQYALNECIAKAENRGASGEPIYQQFVMGAWVDVSKLIFDKWPHEKRIVYLAPPSQAENRGEEAQDMADFIKEDGLEDQFNTWLAWKRDAAIKAKGA